MHAHDPPWPQMRGEMWPAAPWAGLNFVDVRDVAAAHTLAMSHPKAEGRCGLRAGLGGAG